MPMQSRCSPGHVDVEGKAATLEEIIVAYGNFVENYEEPKSQYAVFHKYLSQMGLLRDPDRFDPKGPVAEQIKKYSQQYAGLLGLDYSVSASGCWTRRTFDREDFAC